MNTTELINELIVRKTQEQRIYPDKLEAAAFIDELFQFLFISSRNDRHFDGLLHKLSNIENRLAYLLAETEKDEAVIRQHSTAFFNELPRIYRQLVYDAEALLDFDPAARELSEVIVTYPGFYAIVVYRFSHQLWKQGVKLLPRLLTEYAHSKTGIDIHPGASIGRRLAIDHGTGVVIGETTVIGDDVKIYQGVTLGALHLERGNTIVKRHPTIEDNVIVYSGATILGGDTVIGRDSVVGGNIWLTHSIPANSVVYQKSEFKVKDSQPIQQSFYYVN